MSGYINIPPVSPSAFGEAFTMFHYTEHRLERVSSNGEMSECAVRYAEEYGCDPNDPSLLDHLTRAVLKHDYGFFCDQELEDALARARFFLRLLRRPGGLRYGILYEGKYSDCDIAPHTYSVAATAPCCMVSGFDAEEFDDLWKQASILALAPSGSVWGQSLNGSEREWMQ
jgi:hypothetical protein